MIQIIRPSDQHSLIDLDRPPSLNELREWIDCEYPEIVNILLKDKREQLIVDEDGIRKLLNINHLASALYRNNYLTAFPKTNPESLPCIHGIAILLTSAHKLT